MEGIPGWLLLAVYAALGLGGLAACVALLASLILLAGEPRVALKTLAVALFIAALGAAAMTFATCAGERGKEQWLLANLLALSLTAAGAGQLIAVHQGARAYAASLACAALAAAFAVWPPLNAGGLSSLREALAVSSALFLAAASLGLGMRRSRPFSPWGQLALLGLANLAALSAAVVYGAKDDYIITDDRIDDFVANTHWNVVFIVAAVSALISVLWFIFRAPASRPAAGAPFNPERN
jgi:hypothetical protein